MSLSNTIVTIQSLAAHPGNDHVLLFHPVLFPRIRREREFLFKIPVEGRVGVSEEMTDNFVSQSL